MLSTPVLLREKRWARRKELRFGVRQSWVYISALLLVAAGCVFFLENGDSNPVGKDLLCELTIIMY